MDAAEFMGIVWNALYDVSGIRWLPLIIHSAHEGDFAPIETLARLAYAPAGPEAMSWGMNYAVECAERWSTDSPQRLLAATRNLRAPIDRISAEHFMPMAEICRACQVRSRLPEAREAVTSAIPTLLLSGEFDPGTPPCYAELTARTLKRHYRYVFPGMGHTDGLLSSCCSSIQSQFLDDPTRAPDASCIRKMPDGEFVAPD
jgi:pimeloyl-ACP methyl ester carboxylesterase